jgi:hypothetical protein
MDSDAAFPSSPPHATAYDPPSPPFFAPRSYYDAYSPKSSSPAPIFSSDDSQESHDVTNYQSPRLHKNKRKGAWYETDRGESAMTTPEAKKTRIVRHDDSAIYMMSDMSASSVNLVPDHHVPIPLVDGAYDTPQRRTHNPEARFCSQMNQGLEVDQQSYDFTNMQLTDSDISRVGELNMVINNPPDPGNELPVESQYRSMAPELFVNFGTNSLRRLTPSLFRLEHLTSLTLRNNDIDQLPQQITQLRNLKALDVALNKLKYLPLELLEMTSPFGQLERLTLMGNPLLQPIPELPRLLLTEMSPHKKDLEDIITGESEICDSLYRVIGGYRTPIEIWRIRFLEAWLNYHRQERGILPTATETPFTSFPHQPEPFVEDWLASPRYMARTLVTYYDQAGGVMKGSPIMPAADTDDYPTVIETNRGTWGAPKSFYSPPAPSRVISLATTCLNSALKQETVAETTRQIGEPIPFDVAAILAQAEQNDAGLRYGYFRQCHVCKRDYIIAKAEWVEFWALNRTIIPFNVKVCSWGCVPTQMAKEPGMILE